MLVARKQAGTARFVNHKPRAPVGPQPKTAFLHLKNEIYEAVPWRVEVLNETVAAEIAALPADMQARFLRLAERIAAVGLESLKEPHVSTWKENFGSFALPVATESRAPFMSPRSARGSWWFAHS